MCAGLDLLKRITKGCGGVSESQCWRDRGSWVFGTHLDNQPSLAGKPQALAIDTASENKVSSAWGVTAMVDL